MIFSLEDTIILFYIYSFLGWCVEVIFVAVTTKRAVNRGFLNGPACPIYGIGMLVVLMALMPIYKNVWLLFIGGMIICSTVELVGGFLLDKIFHMRWWDYSHRPFNIGGYVCLPFSIMWGFGVVFAVRFVHRPIMTVVDKMPFVLKVVFIIIFTLVFIIDMVVTLKNIIGIKRSLGQLDKIAEDLHNVGDQIKNVVGSSAIDIVENMEQQKGKIAEASNQGKEKIKKLSDERKEYLQERKLELDKRRERLQTSKMELEKRREEQINKIHKHRKYILNELPTLNKSGSSIKILEYLKNLKR